MKPFYQRIGGKSSMVDNILPFIPKHKIYIEPFFGGGAIFFAKDKSDIEVINDIDKDLINNYKLMKKYKIQNISYDYNTIKEQKNLLHSNKNLSNNQKIIKSIIINKSGIRGFPVKNNIVYRPTNITKQLERYNEYHYRLKNVIIENTNYINIIKKYDSKYSFFYLDPPYQNSKNLYKHDTINYEELKNILDNIKGLFMLSINDSKYIRNLFKGYVIKKFKVYNKLKIKTYRNELLIMNYI
jgi:DNA adenine methylase